MVFVRHPRARRYLLRVRVDGTVRITDLVQIGDFEALLEWVVGTNRQVPFKVTTLSSPSRIVVDLETP